MKINSLYIRILLISVSLFLCHCGGFSSGSDGNPDSSSPVNGQETLPPIEPIPESKLCTDDQLSQIESGIKSSLATIETDADFSLKVESKDGRVFEFNRGNASMTTLYESASTSKWITASIILSFLESSENLASVRPLTLDSHPKDFIVNNWPLPDNHPLNQITLRQLLSFTSGLSEEDNCSNRADSDFETCALATVAANTTTLYRPGQVYFYSSSHLQVAGLMTIKARNIAKKVTNSTWQSVFSDFKAKTGVFKNSQYDLPSATNPRLAGGMHWIGNDYVEFLKLYSQNKILSPASVKLQLADQIGDAIIVASPANKGTGEDWHYGFGLWAECHVTTFNCKDSIETFSSAGAYGAYPFINVKHEFYGLLARQGALGTGFLGYGTYAAVESKIKKWATKDCSE